MDGGTLAAGLELINRRALPDAAFCPELNRQDLFRLAMCSGLTEINTFHKIIWLIWLASDRCHCHNASQQQHQTTRGRKVVASGFRIIGYCFGLLALYAIWRDMTSPSLVSEVFGQFWFEHSPTSLQVVEAIISRYLDPCGLFVSIGCEPFLWHPLIATTLGWPAALMFIFLMLIFLGLARLISRRSLRRTTGRSLKRSGER